MMNPASMMPRGQSETALDAAATKKQQNAPPPMFFNPAAVKK